MSGNKQKSSTKPVYSQQIEGAAGMLNKTYAQQAPKISGIADSLTGMLPEMQEKWRAGNPAVNAAEGYVTDTLGGDGTNPYLDDWIDQTQGDVQNRLGAKLNKMGLGPAGSTYQGLQSRELGKVALGARMDDWNQGQARKANAAGMAPGLAAADVIQVAPMLSTAQLGANLPMNAAYQQAAGIGGLLGPYTNSEQKSSPGFGQMLGMGLQAASLFSDARLKTDIRPVGKTDAGANIYTYRYGGQGPFHMGVMAQEIREAQPDALGPEVGGYLTVNYGEVR